MKLTLEDKLKIIELREKGYGFGTIAKQFKVKDTTIKRICHRYENHGTDGIIHPPKNRTYSPELKLEIINRVFQGESKTSLAAIYNLPGECTIISWMKKYEELGYNGLESKPKGRPKSMPRKPKEETKTIKDNTPLTNEEREELIRLRKEKEYLEMENEVLKKLGALVKERLKQQGKKK